MLGKEDLADQTFVVGAHYDHVGIGGYGSLAPGTVAVHNRAAAKANGTFAMLATARRMMGRLADAKSHRHVFVMGFSAETRSLLGSQHGVRNPVIPPELTVAMVNLDMVGRLRDNELTICGTGSASTFDGFVEKAKEDCRFDLFRCPRVIGQVITSRFTRRAGLFYSSLRGCTKITIVQLKISTKSSSVD